jgi:ABC-type transport system involved in cytochrome c biogenesis permease component
MIGGSLRRVRAVAVRELRDLGRSRTPFVLRLTFAAVIGAILTLALNPLAARNGGEMEPEMLAFMTAGVFKGVVYFQTFVVLLIGAMLGVISSTAERSNKTLGLIVLSRLRAGEVVVGKLLALLGLMVMVLLAAVPLFALLGWGG